MGSAQTNRPAGDAPSADHLPARLPVKPTSLLLIASLLANVALIAVFATRSPDDAHRSARASTGGQTSAPSRDAVKDASLRAALAAGDAKALEAAGLTPELARDVALGRTLSQLTAQIRRAEATGADIRWWRSTTAGNQATRETAQRLRREVAALLGDPSGSTGSAEASQLAFLPETKRAALRRILDDYAEMTAQYTAGGVQLASDRERLRLLRSEKERDIAALLSPDELLAYELRHSASAATVRTRYGDGLETEADFRKVYALQKAFDEKFPAEALTGRISQETLRARTDAQRQLQDDIRSTLGDTAYAQLRRATDTDLRTVDALVSRLGLPAATTDRIATVRESLAAESQRLNADATLNPTQRRAQIQELGNQAKAQINQALGTEAADAYAQRSQWVSLLQGGIAYSTTPQAGSPASLGSTNQSVYPVLPSGSGAPGATRQVIISGNPGALADGTAHREAVGSGAPVIRENVQIMTFSTSGAETAAGAVPGQRTIIVAPPPANPPPKP